MELLNVYKYTVKNIHGEDVSMEKYRGLVLIIVNVASECAFAPRKYREFVELDEKYRDKGLRILAFPCNQFDNMEPDDADSILKYAEKRNVKFEIFKKINVNDNDNVPELWEYLSFAQPGLLFSTIAWNFSTFIVNRNGIAVERLPPVTTLSDMEFYINKYL